MLGLLNTVLTRGGSLLTFVKDGLVMANRFLTPPKLTFPVDASAEFNGSSDYIQLNDPFSYTNHTIAAWVYLDTNAFSTIFDNREANDDGIRLLVNDSNVLFYQLNSSDRTHTLSLNDWIFVTASYDGTTQKLYADGSLVSSVATSQTISVSDYDSNIGKSTYENNYFKGNLANVAIWNRALSSDEINSVMWKSYEALATTEKSGLQAWYKLEESELFDASNTSTTNLEEYAKLNSVTFEGKACLQTALNALPDITDARLYSAKYDIRVSADGGTVEALNCVETELNALL